MTAHDAALSRWKRIADLWCARVVRRSRSIRAGGGVRIALRCRADRALGPAASHGEPISRGRGRRRRGEAILSLGARIPRGVLRSRRPPPGERRLRRGDRQPAVGHDPRRPGSGRPERADARQAQDARVEGTRPRSSDSRAIPASTARSRMGTPTAISCSWNGRSRSRAPADGSGWCCRLDSPPITAARACAASTRRSRWVETSRAHPTDRHHFQQFSRSTMYESSSRFPKLAERAHDVADQRVAAAGVVRRRNIVAG